MKLLEERQKTHGDFIDHASISQALKSVIKRSVNWKDLVPTKRESLEMICHKIARILNGDSNHIDHWLDIEGYAQLIVEELENKE